MNNPKFIIIPSDLEEIDTMSQQMIPIFQNRSKDFALKISEVKFESQPKYIDLRMAFFAPDVIPLLKRIVEVYQMDSEKASRAEMKTLEMQAIELVKEINKAFQL